MSPAMMVTSIAARIFYGNWLYIDCEVPGLPRLFVVALAVQSNRDPLLMLTCQLRLVVGDK